MNIAIHPKWYPEAEVICACGNIFTVGSTKDKIHVEICGRCHPFFTGEMKFVDTQGRVEKFQERVVKASQSNYQAKRLAKKKSKTETEDTRPKTLREMLMELQK